MKAKILIALVAVFGAGLLSAQAHGDLFFEFAPRVSDRLNIAAQTETVDQVFRPQNDYLSGFDFWVDNEGAPGEVTFEFFDDEETIFRSKAVPIPTIPKIPNGTKIHVDFGSQAPVINTKTYKIRITTDLPQFNIYHSNRIQLLQHDQTIFSEFDFGGVKLGETTKDYSFKFALYETEEGAAPIIENVSIEPVSLTEAKVLFNANEAVDYKVRYGRSGEGLTITTDFKTTYTLCGEGVGFCELAIAVEPDTTYTYELVVKDEWGNETQVSGGFLSAESPPESKQPAITPLPEDEDRTAPSIVNLRIVTLTPESVRIAWTTDEVADSELKIILVSNSNAIVTLSDSVSELEHNLKTQNVLTPNTQYFAMATSKDRAGNSASRSVAVSTPSVAVTPEPPPPPPEPEEEPPPTEEEPLPPPVDIPDVPTPNDPIQITVEAVETTEEVVNEDGSVTIETRKTSTVTITWQVPEEGPPADGYRVDLFDAGFKLQDQTFTTSGKNSTKFSDLAPGDYYVVVYANNNGVFERIGEMIKFTVTDPHGADFLSSPWFYALIVAFVLLGIFGLKIEQKRREIENELSGGC